MSNVSQTLPEITCPKCDGGMAYAREPYTDARCIPVEYYVCDECGNRIPATSVRVTISEESGMVPLYIQPATRAKLDARRRAHDWTWDEYLEIIGSLEEAFDE